MNQNHSRRIAVTCFLIVNLRAVHLNESRSLNVKNNVTVLVPINVAWTRQKLCRNRGSSNAGKARK